jgi:hypothetical protein
MFIFCEIPQITEVKKTKNKKTKNKKTRLSSLNYVMYCPFHKNDMKCNFFHEFTDCYDFIKHGKCYTKECNKNHNENSQDYHNSRRNIMEKMQISDDLDNLNATKYLLLEYGIYSSGKISQLKSENDKFV